MAILEYNEVRENKIIVYQGEPCKVLESHVARTQQRKPQNQVKLKSLLTGKTYNETFHVSDKIDEADIIKREVKFLYQNRGELWFCDPGNPSDRFKLESSLIGESARFLKDNTIVTAVIFDDDGEEKTISVELPVKMEFVVKDAPPAIKGDTRTGGNKQVTLENGATILTPLFIAEGDKIIVNTVTGEYAERA